MCFIWGLISNQVENGRQLNIRRNLPSIRSGTIVVLEHEGSMIHLYLLQGFGALFSSFVWPDLVVEIGPFVCAHC